MISPEVEGLRPAGLCFGRAPLVASAGGGFDALVADVRALVAAVAPFAGNGQVALVTAVSQAVDIALRTPRDLPFVVLPSSGIAAGKVVAVALPALAAALGVPAVEASRSAVLHMEDTNPQPIAPGGALASPVYSIFQLIRPRSDCDGRLDGSPARAARWHGSAAQRGDDYGR